MNLRFTRLLFALLTTFSLFACAARPSRPTTDTAPAPPSAATPAPSIPTLTPTFPSEACGYQWATQDLPELSAQFEAAVKEQLPKTRAHATAFGENCLGNEGQVIRFLTMETDFYVFIPVDALDQFEAFGNAIAQVMEVVNSLPPETIPGPMPGFVALRFEKDQAEGVGIRVPIQQYKDTANGVTGEALFRMFYQAP